MALLHPTFLDSVVAIGSCTSEEKRNWCATGFAYGFFVGMGADGRTPQDAAFLVTNRHVKEGIQGDIVIRCNPKEGGTGADVALSARDAEGQLRWTAHPDEDVDVAVLPLDLDFLRTRGMQITHISEIAHAADLQRLNAIGASEGGGIYVLGFPIPVFSVSERFNSAIVRQGVIARIQDTLRREVKDFIVDASVFFQGTAAAR